MVLKKNALKSREFFFIFKFLEIVGIVKLVFSNLQKAMLNNITCIAPKLRKWKNHLPYEGNVVIVLKIGEG